MAGILSLDDIVGTDEMGRGIPPKPIPGEARRERLIKRGASLEYESDDFDEFDDSIAQRRNDQGVCKFPEYDRGTKG